MIIFRLLLGSFCFFEGKDKLGGVSYNLFVRWISENKNIIPWLLIARPAPLGAGKTKKMWGNWKGLRGRAVSRKELAWLSWLIIDLRWFQGLRVRAIECLGRPASKLARKLVNVKLPNWWEVVGWTMTNRWCSSFSIWSQKNPRLGLVVAGRRAKDSNLIRVGRSRGICCVIVCCRWKKYRNIKNRP